MIPREEAGVCQGSGPAQPSWVTSPGKATKAELDSEDYVFSEGCLLSLQNLAFKGEPYRATLSPSLPTIRTAE